MSVVFVFRVVLGAVPLDLDQESETLNFPRSWMLPVLKIHIQATELAYFRDTMMPLADRLGARGVSRRGAWLVEIM